jgi:hypothetical protein
MIDEILWMQKKHHDIIDNSPNPAAQQTSLAELHRLNITPSNYFYVAPDISGNSTISTTSPPEAKTTTTDNLIIV